MRYLTKRKPTGSNHVDELLAASFEGLDGPPLRSFRGLGRRIAMAGPKL